MLNYFHLLFGTHDLLHLELWQRGSIVKICRSCHSDAELNLGLWPCFCAGLGKCVYLFLPMKNVLFIHQSSLPRTASEMLFGLSLVPLAVPVRPVCGWEETTRMCWEVGGKPWKRSPVPLPTLDRSLKNQKESHSSGSGFLMLFTVRQTSSYT